jgi:hypothetical protein
MPVSNVEDIIRFCERVTTRRYAAGCLVKWNKVRGVTLKKAFGLSQNVCVSRILSFWFCVPDNNYVTYLVLFINMLNPLLLVAYCRTSCLGVRCGYWFGVRFLLWLPVYLLMETPSRTLQGRCDVHKQRWRKITFQSLNRGNFYKFAHLHLVKRLRNRGAIHLLLP